MVERTTKFTIACIVIYLVYAISVFFILPFLMPDAIEMQRRKIKYHTKGLNLNLSDYIEETGGAPIRSLFISFYGSGAYQMLEMLSTCPGCYNHFSPLLAHGYKEITSEFEADIALHELVDLYHCNYTNMEDLLHLGKRDRVFKRYYGRQWELCRQHPKLCWNVDFLSQLCKIFPFQNMITYGLRLKFLAPLLELIGLNVRIVLLVRDPRGTMQSRRHRVWCAGNPDCEDPRLVCEDLVADYKSAEDLLKKYPSRFRTLRYEDLSLNPYDITQDILQFYGLPFDPMVEEFLDTHTKVNIGGVSSTYRDSRSAPFHWKQDLKIDEIKQIQDVCGKAMELWGYRKIENFTDYQRSFDPIVLPPPFT